MTQFAINGTTYYFYPSNYIKYGSKNYTFLDRGPGPTKKITINGVVRVVQEFIDNYEKGIGKDTLLLFDDGILYFREKGAGLPQPTGLKVDESTIASKAEIKTYESEEAEEPLIPTESENETIVARFPMTGVIVGLGVLALLGFGLAFLGKRKK